MVRKTALLVAVAAPLTWLDIASSAQAAQIVNWEGDLVSGNVNFTRTRTSQTGDFNGDTADDFRRGYALDLNTPLLATGVSYSGVPFYGGAVHTLFSAITGADLTTARINNSTPVDRIHLVAASGASTGAFHQVLLWKKDAFLEGGAAPAVTFATDSQISVKLPSGNSAFTGRFLVQDGSTLYISQTTFAEASGTKTLPNPGHANWAVYNPSGLGLDFAGSDFTSHVFTDIRAAGVYIEQDAIAANSGTFVTLVSGFSATAVVPEPSAVLVLSAGVLLLRRRKR